MSFQIVFYIKNRQGSGVNLHVQLAWSVFASDHLYLSLSAPLPPDFAWETSLNFGRDARAECHLLSQASRHAYKQDGRLCFSCVWAFCFSRGREGGLVLSVCYRKAESAYMLCPSGLSFHSAHFSTKRSSYFNSPFACSCSFSVSPALSSQSPAHAVRWLRLRAFIFKKESTFLAFWIAEKTKKLSRVQDKGVETRKTIEQTQHFQKNHPETFGGF